LLSFRISHCVFWDTEGIIMVDYITLKTLRVALHLPVHNLQSNMKNKY